MNDQKVISLVASPKLFMAKIYCREKAVSKVRHREMHYIDKPEYQNIKIVNR